MRLRLRLIFDAEEEDCLENLIDENDCLDLIFVFFILLLRDDEILLHVSFKIKLMRFLTIFSKLNDERTFEKFTRNREFIFFVRFHFALLLFSHLALKKLDDVINNVTHNVHLNSLRVDMRAIFNAVLLRILFASHLILTVLRDMFLFVTVEILSDYAVSNESLAFFDLVVDN
jgi:hypothetical protein